MATSTVVKVARVLVVDDLLPFLCDITQELGQKGDREVEQAAGAEEALKVLAEHPNFDVIITNYRMGEGRLDGIQFAKRLLENGIKTPVVLVTSLDVGKLPPNITLTLGKPATPYELNQAIDICCPKH